MAIMQERHKAGRLPRGIMHCFSGSWETAKVYLKMGYYISLSGVVTFKNANKLLDVARNTPADRLLVETPSYMHYLVSQKMMDELFFNYSCIYVGGQALTIGKFGKEFTSQDHPHTRMLSIHTHSDHFFYLRHKLLYD